MESYDNDLGKERKKSVLKIIIAVIAVLLILLILYLTLFNKKYDSDQKYVELKNKIYAAAKKYVENNENIIEENKPGSLALIKLKDLAKENLIEAQLENPNYDGSLFKRTKEEKYYSLENTVRLSIMSDGSLNCELIENSTDVTAPTLKLSGDSIIKLAVGTELVDPGFSSTDDYDGDLTSRVVRSGNVDTSKKGEYTITYRVEDSAGNVSSIDRKIIVDDYSNLKISTGSIIDKVGPSISLKGSNPYCMVKGTKYVEPGANAIDNFDGNITDKIAITNKVTGNLIGSFRVKYSVTDSAGNETVVYRSVIVSTECAEPLTNTEEEKVTIANNAPALSIFGQSAIVISKGVNYIDLGANAYDKEDGDITNKIITDTSEVNTDKNGVYKVKYRVEDSAGEIATAIRIVTVKSNDIKKNTSVMFVDNKQNIDIMVNKGTDELLSLPKAIDENKTSVKVTMQIEDYNTKVNVSKIDWNKVGKYRVTYIATNGNVTQLQPIIVTIYSDDIIINGDSITIKKRSQNCDLNQDDLKLGGISVTSSGEEKPLIKLDQNQNIVCTVDSYEVILVAQMKDGNLVTKSIKVNVVEGDEEYEILIPEKTIITSNSVSPNNPYNSEGIWAGGDITEINLNFKTKLKKDSELAYFEYSVDCENSIGVTYANSNESGELSWNTEGKYNVCIRAVTTAGVTGEWSSPVKIYFDTTGPLVNFTHTWADGKDDWHNDKSLELEYKAENEENGSPFHHFEYTYDDVKANEASKIVTREENTGKLIVTEDTEKSRPQLFVYVRAVDEAGNHGEWTINPAYANIDTVKPEKPTLTINNDNSELVSINIDFKDGESVRSSGYGGSIYVIDEEPPKVENSKIITLPSNETNEYKDSIIIVWSVDKAGNISIDYSTIVATVAPKTINSNEELALLNEGLAVAQVPTSCEYSNLSACRNEAETMCPNGYTGCSFKSSGCYGGYTCKTTAKTTTTTTTTTKTSCSYKNLSTCKNEAETMCPNGYTGCSFKSSGCYSEYTCKTDQKCDMSSQKICEINTKCNGDYKLSCSKGSNGCWYGSCKLSEKSCTISNCEKCNYNNTSCTMCKTGYKIVDGKCRVIGKNERYGSCLRECMDKYGNTKSKSVQDCFNSCKAVVAKEIYNKYLCTITLIEKTNKTCKCAKTVIEKRSVNGTCKEEKCLCPSGAIGNENKCSKSCTCTEVYAELQTEYGECNGTGTCTCKSGYNALSSTCKLNNVYIKQSITSSCSNCNGSCVTTN